MVGSLQVWACGQQQAHDLRPPKLGCLVQWGLPALVGGGGVGAMRLQAGRRGGGCWGGGSGATHGGWGTGSWAGASTVPRRLHIAGSTGPDKGSSAMQSTE